jgi:hypothetical protein
MKCHSRRSRNWSFDNESNGENYKFAMSNLISPQLGVGWSVACGTKVFSSLSPTQLVTRATYKREVLASFRRSSSSSSGESTTLGRNQQQAKRARMYRDCLSGMSTKWLCCPRRLVLGQNAFSLPKNKSEQRAHCISPFFSIASRCFFLFQLHELFIDIIMGNFRQHGRIYFTSCFELIEFRMSARKKKR